MYCPVKKQIIVAPEKSSFCPLCGQAIDSTGKHISTPKPERELYCPVTKQSFTVSMVPSKCPKCGKFINTITGQHIETPPPPPLRTIYCPNQKLSFKVDTIPSICPKCGKAINTLTGEHFDTTPSSSDKEGCKKNVITVILIIVGIIVMFICFEFGTGATIGGLSIYGLFLAAVKWYEQKYGKE